MAITAYITTADLDEALKPIKEDMAVLKGKVNDIQEDVKEIKNYLLGPKS